MYMQMQINGIHWNGTERNGKEWNAMHVCMYACMHVCMYACIIYYTYYLRMHVFTQRLFLKMSDTLYIILSTSASILFLKGPRIQTSKADILSFRWSAATTIRLAGGLCRVLERCRPRWRRFLGDPFERTGVQEWDTQKTNSWPFQWGKIWENVGKWW